MKPIFKRLYHIQISIPPGAETAAREFYGGVLGLPELAKPDAVRPKYFWYAIADIELHIGSEEGQVPSERHPAFEVENLDSLRSYLETRGVTTRDAVTLPAGRRFFFYDPFGNRIEVLEKC